MRAVGGERRPVGLPGSNRSGHHATWRSLDAEIGGPVRGSGHFGRGLRRYQHHHGAVGAAPHRPPAPASQPAAPSAEAPSAVRQRRESTCSAPPTRPKTRHASGGTVIIGDWQEATQFNPYYLGPGHRGQRRLARRGTRLLTITDDYKYVPAARGRADPDHRQRWRDGSAENGDAMTVTWKLRDGLKWSDGEPLTCDDFKYAWEWVIDPDNVGVVTTGFEDMTELRVPVRHRHGPALQERLRGLPHPGRRAAAAPLPVQDPDQGPGQRRGLPPRRDRQAAGPAARSSSSRSRPAAELRLAQQRRTTELPKTGKPANLDSVVFKWYGDPDAMIAGFRAGEIDIAFDLQDSDIPKVQDLGDQVARDPGAPVRVPAPELVARTVRRGRHQAGRRRLLAQPGGPGSRHRLPDGRPGDPRGDRLRDRQERDQHAAPRRQRPGREHERQPGGLVLRGPDRRRPSTRRRPSRSSADGGWTDTDGDGIVEKDGLKAKIELCTTTRQVRQDTLALISAWLKDVGIDSVINPVDADRRSSPTTTRRTADTPCVLVAQQLRPR